VNKEPSYVSLASDEVTKNGLIDPRGRFYPCPFTGHNDLWDRLRETGLGDRAAGEEGGWIKVSSGIWTGMTVFVLLDKHITVWQKQTVERIVREHKIMDQPDSERFIQVGYGNFLVRDTEGNMRWEHDHD
jgi:hypothetical protein